MAPAHSRVFGEGRRGTADRVPGEHVFPRARTAEARLMAPTPWDPETTAIVCVECQNGVLGPESVLPALAADSSELVSSVARLLESPRQFGARVVDETYGGNIGGGAAGTARIWGA